MLAPEKYFDELYEYVDLWASGYVKAYMPKISVEEFVKVRTRLVESIISRIEVVNRLRSALKLDPMNVNDSYDYYINNMPEFSDEFKRIDLVAYDNVTNELSKYEDDFRKKDSAKAYLIVMGAPDVFLENHNIVQKRIDHINYLLREGGYEEMDNKKTEEVLLKILVTSNW